MRIVATQFARHPRTRKFVIGFISIVALFGVVGALVAPPLLRFEDRSLTTPSRIAVSELSIQAQNLSNAKNTRAKATLRARINKNGSVVLGGTAVTNPLKARFDVEVAGVELLPFDPYLADRVNFLLAGGQLGTKGHFSLATASDGSSRMNYEGDLHVADFASIEKGGAQDLLRWKSLDLGGVRLSMHPVLLHISDITLDSFYSRVIIASDGKINLQNLVQKNAQAETGNATSEPAAAATREPTPPVITIGKINLQNGNVNFSDFFVKPNYTVNLTQLQGSISELRAETPGNLLLESKAPKSVDEVQIEKGEYERYLRAAYREETFPGPRNLIGLFKDLPVAEMEALMLQHTQVTEDDLRALANRRAQAIRDRLLETGKVEADRLFLVAAKPVSAQERDPAKAKSSRVDFSLR